MFKHKDWQMDAYQQDGSNPSLFTTAGEVYYPLKLQGCTNSVRKSRHSVMSPHPNDLMVKNITLPQYNKV